MDALQLSSWVHSLTLHLKASVGLVLMKKRRGLLLVRYCDMPALINTRAALPPPTCLHGWTIDDVGSLSVNDMVARLSSFKNVIFAAVVPSLPKERLTLLDPAYARTDSPSPSPSEACNLSAINALLQHEDTHVEEEVYEQHLGVIVHPSFRVLLTAHHNEIRQVTFASQLSLSAIVAMMEERPPSSLLPPPLSSSTQKEREANALYDFLDMPPAAREEKVMGFLRLAHRSDEIPPCTSRSVLGYQTQSISTPVVTPRRLFNVEASVSSRLSNQVVARFTAVIPYDTTHSAYKEGLVLALDSMRDAILAYLREERDEPATIHKMVWDRKGIEGKSVPVPAFDDDPPAVYVSTVGTLYNVSLWVLPIGTSSGVEDA